MKGLCCADEANRHKRRACCERHARGATVSWTVAVDGAMREDRNGLPCLECLPHSCEREVIAAATGNSDRAEAVERPCEKTGKPKFHLHEETQFP